MDEPSQDKVGRLFCGRHRRDTCHECCVDYRSMNEQCEIEVGIRKAPSRMQELAEEKLMLVRGMEFMQQQGDGRGGVPPVMKENFKYHQDMLKKVEKEIASLKSESQGQEFEAAASKAAQKFANEDAERLAIAQAWKKENPSKHSMSYGGPETQRLFDQFASAPANIPTSNHLTCSFCRKNSTTPLMKCAACRNAYYCDKDCQKQGWRGHKLECAKPDNETKKKKYVSVSWSQLEKFQGQSTNGKALVVKVLSGESFTRQVLSCKDSEGVVKRIAAYTDSRHIPGAVPGAVLRWANPRFHYFADGSDGARIEQEDLANITIE